MIFSTMQTELSDRLAVYDSTVSADATKLKRWLNMAQQDITGQQNWPFMLYHETLQTVIDITAGTIAIAAGSAALTFSSGPAVSATDWFIKFSGDSNWYRISSHTAGATSATLSIAYGGTSSLTASSYTLRKLFYATATPLDSILDVKETVSGRVLEVASPADADVFLPLYWDSGSIYKYISSIPDSGGGLRLSFLYSPSVVENLQVRGIKKLTDMSSDSDVSAIPSRWHSAIIDLATFYGFSSVDDNRADKFYQKAMKTVDDMAATFDFDLGRLRVTRSLNAGVFEGPAYALPPQYGVSQD